MDDPHHGDEYRERIKPLIDKHLEHDIRVLLRGCRKGECGPAGGRAHDQNGGVMMTARKTPKPVSRTQAEDIADIESMSDEEIDRELREVHGIDPDRAVAKIAASVREKMNAWDPRRQHHAIKEMVARRTVPHPAGEE
jgi:hypothetical protein